MLRWEDFSGFYMLFLIPAILLLWWWMRSNKQRQRDRFISTEMMEKLINFRVLDWVKPVLLGMIVLFLAIAYVNPQAGLKKEKQKVENSDIFIALDISNSMNVRDISPSRIEKSKKFISDFLLTRYGDQVGLIYFAGSAFLQMPLTTDIAAAGMFVKAVNTNMAGTQGTNIGEALQLALKSTQEPQQKAILLISDGEDHDDKAIEMARQARDKGWSVFTVSVGTEAGALVPVNEDGRETYIYDDKGNPVKSVVNKTLLKDIAAQGGGTYYNLTDDTRSVIMDINQRLEKMQKHLRETRSYTEYASYYQYFLFPAIVLLLVGFFYDFKRRVS